MAVVRTALSDAQKRDDLAARLREDANPLDSQLADFLAAHPDFDLARTSIDAYLSRPGGGAMRTAGEDGRALSAPAVSRLKALQRIFRLTPRYDEMRPLLAGGLDSAHKIARTGEHTFVARYGQAVGGDDRARAIYSRAAQTSARTHAALMKYLEFTRATAPAFVRRPALGMPAVERAAAPRMRAVEATSTSQLPDLESLFGSLDFCDCEDCRSVLSPAAYLVDLLALLAGTDISARGDGGQSAGTMLDVLFRRRPDIGEIELTCENTNVPVPYVDLVNEVLEAAVARHAATDDFSPTQNPAGAWSYGYRTNASSPFTALNLHGDRPSPGLQTWYASGVQPFITRNRTDGNAQYDGVVQPTRMLHLRSGAPSSGAITVLRWTAPAADQIRIAGRFERLEPGTPPAVYVLHNTTAVLPPTAVDAAGLPFSIVRTVAAGDTIDFCVGGMVPGAEPPTGTPGRGVGLSARIAPAARQTRGTADELAAGPEYVVSRAYDELSVAVYPPTLPFDLSSTEARAYLERLGVTRQELIESFVALEAAGGGFEAGLTEIDLATERLGLAAMSRDMITGATLPSNPAAWQFWGYPSEHVVDPIAPGDGQPVAWSTALAHVPELMHRGGMSFAELTGLLEVGWVNPGGAMAIEVNSEEASVDLCDDLRHLDVSATNANAFARMRRFLRLWRALGWTMRETDAALRALGATDLDAELLIRLSHVRRLREHLTVPLREILTWWAPVDTRAYETSGLPRAASLYEQVFQSQAVKALSSGTTSDPFALNAQRDELANIGHISEHLPALGAALELNAGDLSLLVNAQAAALALNVPSEISDDRLTLANLSRLYRIASFSRALRLSVREFLLIKAWSGIDPFQREHTSDTLRFVDMVRKTRAAGVDVTELDYLLRHVAAPSSRVAPSDTDLARVLEELREGMTQLEPAHRPNFVKQRLAQTLGLDVAVVERLLLTWIRSYGTDPDVPAMIDYLALAGTAQQITRAEFPEQFASLTLLLKIARLMRPLNLTLRAATWIFDRGHQLGWLDPRTLPLSPVASAHTLHAGWTRLLEFLRLRAPLGDETPFDLLDRLTGAHGDVPALLTEIGRLTGWDRNDVAVLLAADSGTIELPVPQADRVLVATAGAIAQTERSGASAAMLRQWATESSPQVARSIRQALKARYPEHQWPAVAKPLRDALRERQRSALVDYLLVNPALIGVRHFASASGLYDHFLLDVEMGSCLMTSRITQAIGSVQLFIQRSLMRMERDVVLAREVAADLTAQWDWMKNYRLWEGNRRIFLYPENWIRPELRDDKSPFFKELEDELLQNDVTMDTAEQGFLHYLEKLDAVAHLEVCAVRPQRDAQGALQVLHVFGRTWNTPHTYYYRCWKDHEWSAWEKVHLDIEGDHLLAAVHDRRLYLMWAVFSEKATAASNGSGPLTKYWEVKLAWSERRHGRWSPKQVSTAPLIYADAARPTVLPPRERFGLKTFAAGPGQELTVVCEWDEAPAVTVALQARTPRTANAAALESRASLATASASRAISGALNPYPRDPIPEPIDEPEIWVSPEAAARGQTFTVDGAWFRRNQSVTLTVQWPNGSGSEELRATADNAGGFSIAYPTNAQTAPIGRYAVLQGSVEVAAFDVTAPVTLDVTGSVFVGEIVTITARGLSPRAAATFSIGGANDVNGIADNAGTITVTHTATTAGTFRVTLAGTSLERTFTVTARPAAETLRETTVIGAFMVTGRGPVTIENGPAGFDPTTIPRDTVLHATAFVETGESQFSLFTPGTAGAPADVEPLLALTPGRFRLVPPREHHGAVPLPFFFQDEARAFYVTEAAGRYRFVPFYHAYVDRFVRELNAGGVDRLFERSVQVPPADTSVFASAYRPYSVVTTPHPREDVAFDGADAYASYNWELFFHAPLLIASRLSQNQRFAEAQRWFHYIFDPLDSSNLVAPARYWRTRPLYEATDQGRVQDELRRLFRPDLEEPTDADGEELDAQVERWRLNPFNPHLVARLRGSAYPKAVVMQYIDNLIAWGDQLFRRDTMESLNEATQLYLLAASILGARPQAIPPRTRPAVKTFNELQPDLDAFANALVDLEAPATGPGTGPTNPGPSPTTPRPTPQVAASVLGQTLYFGIPANDKLGAYWDRVDDRLFKIRHCMTIEGVTRRLPLFEPRIDPSLLVKAQAAGVDLGSALSAVSPTLPRYHYQTMAQKAAELCGDVRALGGALLSAIEKRDGEALALLRSTHEIQVLQAVRLTKEAQIAEAQAAMDGLRKSREVVSIRHQHYKNIEFMTPWETVHLSLSGAALLSHAVGAVMYMAAGATKTVVPDAQAGICGIGPHLTAKHGGSHVGGGLESWATGFKEASALLSMGAGISATVGSHWRRWDEWKLQEKLAAGELVQIDKQIAAAEIRHAIAVQELKNHDRQVANAQAVDAYMREKFSNREMYDWMVGQISAIYFQTYQLAYDVARRAQKAFEYDLGMANANFIEFRYWDSLKKGLLAGERLQYDLQRMSVAYLEQNQRHYEIARNISLAMLDPAKLLLLKATGACEIALPEALFDFDHPGHYMRRIKSVSLTIPAVAGPYTSINCTLTLLSNRVRKDPGLAGGYACSGPGDARFFHDLGAIQSIVTSHGQNDSGMFELSFRDDRYLPFEGAGVDSTWRIELPLDCNQFDLDTISDVILHVRYTARDGGTDLRAAAVGARPRSGVRLFSLRHEFPTEWARFKSAHPDPTATIGVDLQDAHYPYWTQGRPKTVEEAALFARTTATRVEITEHPDGTGRKDALIDDNTMGDLRVGTLANLPKPAATGRMTLHVDDNAMKDLYVALRWTTEG